MTAIDLLHHVFGWEVASGVERLEAEDTDRPGDDGWG